MKQVKEARKWFHEREGELFRSREIPFERRVVVKLVNDSVDPVQQIIADGERYIGVINYQEYDGWYEYTRWNDSTGKIKIGVCARCVQKAGKVAEVSRTIGDNTGKAKKKFREHYRRDHNRKPDDVETGATLLSGTTIGGNEAIHVGMDGDGSGVDTDFVLGVGALKTASFYEAKFTGTNKEPQFSTPSGTPVGVGLDSNGCVWNADRFEDSIYELDQNGSILTGFSSPSANSTGIGIDANDCVWLADNGAESLYQMSQSPTLGQPDIISQFASPSGSPQGVGLDSNDCVWNADSFAYSVFKLDKSGNVQGGFNTPSDNPEGVGLDSGGCVWHADDANSIYRLDRNGNVIAKFASPSNSPEGVGLDGSGCIWHSDSRADSIYRMKLRDIVEFPQN